MEIFTINVGLHSKNKLIICISFYYYVIDYHKVNLKIQPNFVEVQARLAGTLLWV